VTGTTDTRDALRRIADAVLYEGYVLWPYRKSALKNQRRWTFGGVYPPRHAEAHPDDPSVMRTECLVDDASGATLGITVRFLHVVERKVERWADGRVERIDELEVDGERHVAWDEATEREVPARLRLQGDGPCSCNVAIDFPAESAREELRDSSGRTLGALVRSWRALAGTVEVTCTPLGDERWRVVVEVRNESRFEAHDREEALRQTLCSTHTVLHVDGGSFLSLTDPPEEAREAATRCRNTGTWPVLVGEHGERHTMLSSPIILPDYPEVAPESPGDLFDAGEIDQLLVLSILSLTDEEREEMRASDPRAREILERTESLSEEQLMRLHGAIREFGMAQGR
jgi:hypothetical protein